MNKKLADFFCDPKTAVKNVALLLLMVFLVIYAFFQILPTFTQNITTETALLVSVYDTCKTTGYMDKLSSLLGCGSAGRRPPTGRRGGWCCWRRSLWR